MTRFDIVSECEKRPGSGVYFLGSFASRVTVYSQQVRALNLVDALVSRGLVPQDGRVAIIGGGISGVTAAAAFRVAIPTLEALDLFERRGELMHLQRGSYSRYLHPHIYDWPATGSLETDAGLPLLNWQADTAHNVAARLARQFRALETPPMRIHFGVEIEGLELLPRARGGWLLPKRSLTQRHYDAIVVATGFGYEHTRDRGSSYWDPVSYERDLRTADPDPEIFISGNGDGGLVEFAIAACDARTHAELISFVRNEPAVHELAAQAVAIDKIARSAGAGFDLYEAYQRFLIPPPHLLSRVARMLRPRVRVVFHTHRTHVLRLDTSLLNRLLFHLIVEAAAGYGYNTVRVIRGHQLLGDPYTSTALTVENVGTFQPWKRLLRFGTDRNRNLEPFRNAVLDPTSVSHTDAFSEAPCLTETARERFANAGRFGTSLTLSDRTASFSQPLENKEVVKPKPVVLAGAFPFLHPGNPDWHANLVLGCLLHDRCTIPGSLVLKDPEVASIITDYRQLLGSDALVLDLRDNAKGFSEFLRDAKGGGTLEQARTADLLDEWCREPLRFDASACSASFHEMLLAYIGRECANEPSDQLKRFIEQINSAAPNTMSRAWAYEMAHTSRLRRIVNHLYAVCGADTLLADLQLPARHLAQVGSDLTAAQLASNTIDLAHEALFELCSVDNELLRTLTAEDILAFRDDGIIQEVRTLLRQIVTAEPLGRNGRSLEFEEVHFTLRDRLRTLLRNEQRQRSEIGTLQRSVGGVLWHDSPSTIDPLTVYSESVRTHKHF